MLRYTLAVACLLSLTGLSSGGCRSCSSCHDYDPPVANCQCALCGAPGNCSQCNGGCDQQTNGAYAQPGTAPAANANGAYAKAPSNQPQQPPQRTYRPATANAAPQQ